MHTPTRSHGEEHSQNQSHSTATLVGSLQWWPTAAGLLLAVFVGLNQEDGRESAPILAASGLVYLGAAALRKPGAAWPLFFGTFAVITAARLNVMAVDATWVLLGAAFLLAGYGWLKRTDRPFDALPLQTLAMIGTGAGAAIALIVGGDVAAYVVAAGLFGHAMWDAYHHWTNKVVVRSMAEFCCVLDTALAVGIVAAVVRA
jgi:hypothetical protein